MLQLRGVNIRMSSNYKSCKGSIQDNKKQQKIIQTILKKDNLKKVGILMGSPNDYNKMKEAKYMLDTLGIENEIKVLSAHRQPEEVAELSKNARDNGFAAFICGAGMAAHLAGVVSAHTTLPVVGVPLSGSALNGVDALYATVQMPKGIPVATVAIDNSTNAALLVAQMLSINDVLLYEKLEIIREKTREQYNDIELPLSKSE
jgi:5-(carboxyamino)imidazole ribonucleotide mutase